MVVGWFGVTVPLRQRGSIKTVFPVGEGALVKCCRLRRDIGNGECLSRGICPARRSDKNESGRRNNRIDSRGRRVATVNTTDTVCGEFEFL